MKKSTLLIVAGIVAVLALFACAVCFIVGVIAMPGEDTTVAEVTAVVRPEYPTFTPTAIIAPPPAETPQVQPVAHTATPVPPSPPAPSNTPTPSPIGMSRSNPFPHSQAVSAPNWDFQILEVMRGDAAWQAVQAANQFNEPPPAGMEYLTVKLGVKCTYTDSEEHSIGENDFRVTGDHLTEYSTASAVSPDPQLDARLFTGGEAEGWATYLIHQGESNLILFIDELFSFEEDRYRYVALDEGASINVSPALAEIAPTDLGNDRANPAPLNQTVTTEDWQVTILEVIRGDPAWTMIQSTNQFNDPPAEGMEYILAKVRVRNISTADESEQIDDNWFETTGNANVLYDPPSVVEPDPALDVVLFPGGQYEGWAVMQAAIGETNLVAVFEPLFDLSDRSKRFLSLQ